MNFCAALSCPHARRAVVAVFAAGTLAGCGGTRPASSLSATDKVALDDYEQIRLALADDDARNAKRAAAKMVADLKPADDKTPAPPLLEPAAAVADATALDTMRQRFEQLSDRVVPMVRGVDGYYVMSSDLPNTVPWVQRTKEVDNPFTGKMLHWIGEPKK